MKPAITTLWRQKLAVELQKEGRKIFKRGIYASLGGEGEHELEDAYLAELQIEDLMLPPGLPVMETRGQEN